MHCFERCISSHVTVFAYSSIKDAAANCPWQRHQIKWKMCLCISANRMQTVAAEKGYKCDVRKMMATSVLFLLPKIEGYNASNAEIIDLPTEEERRSLTDPLRRLEHKEVNLRKSRMEQMELANMREEKTFVCNNDARLNQLIRRRLRSERKDTRECAKRWSVWFLPSHLVLDYDSA